MGDWGYTIIDILINPFYKKVGAERCSDKLILCEGEESKPIVGEKVVLVEFWTFGCYNCRNTHPHIQDYWRSYEDEGLVVIGVHYPEFAYEAERDNVEAYVNETNTTYPVVLNNNGGTWDAYDQRFWPTRYLIGVDGFVRYEHIGEGGYEETDRRIRELLAERDRVRNATDA